MSDEQNAEPVVGEYVGVDEQYQNAANDYDLPYKAPGDGEPVFHPSPEALFVTKDPDFGFQTESTSDEDVAPADEDAADESDNQASPVPGPPTPPAPGE